MNYETMSGVIGAAGGALAAGIAVWGKMRATMSTEKADRAVNNAEIELLNKWKVEAEEWETRYLELDKERDAMAVACAVKDAKIETLSFMINELNKCPTK